MAPRETRLGQLRSTVIKHYRQIPYLRKLPAPATGIIVALVVVNLICWAGAGVVLVGNSGEVAYIVYLLMEKGSTFIGLSPTHCGIPDS